MGKCKSKIRLQPRTKPKQGTGNMKQYCVYCAGCVEVAGDLYCDTMEKDLTMNQAKHENYCPKFFLSPAGHVLTGKKYRPQKWRYMRPHDQLESIDTGL